MFEFNKSTIKRCSDIQRTLPYLLLASTLHQDTSVPFASIATLSPSPSPSPSKPSLFASRSPAPLCPSPLQSQSSGSSPRWWRRHPAHDNLRPRQPLAPPLLVLLAPVALLAPLRAFAPADHHHFSPPAPIKATAPPPFVVATRMFPPPWSNRAVTDADAGPLRRQRPPPTPPPLSLYTLVDCWISSNFDDFIYPPTLPLSINIHRAHLFVHTPKGMVQAWVAKKLLNVTFEEFLRCPFFALGPWFHENRDILEVVYYNVKLLY